MENGSIDSQDLGITDSIHDPSIRLVKGMLHYHVVYLSLI